MASIETPTDGSSFDEGVPIPMQGRVIDDAYRDDLTVLAVTWAVNGARVCDGALLDAAGISTCDWVFDAGDAEISFSVTDPEGQTATDKANVTVTPNAAPTAEILAPVIGGTYYANVPIVFEGLVADTEDAGDLLLVRFDDDVDGELPIDGTPTSAGEVSGTAMLSEGNHFITMTVTDSTGRTGEDTVPISVGAPNTAPSCAITAPPTGTFSQVGETLLLEGSASDPDVPANTLSVTWESDKDGTLGVSTPNSSGDFFLGLSTLTVNTHTITLRVADDVGTLCTDAILVTVGNGPSLVLDSPATGDIFNQDEDIHFSATVSDPDDDATSLTFSWESDLDGVFSTQGANSSGLAAFTLDRLSPGTHTITVTATDPAGFTSLDRATIHVNSLPGAPTVEITPDPATSADNLVANIVSAAVDPDGDPITYRYEWYQNGVLTSHTANTIPTTDHSRGENWEVRVYANDGFGDGPAGTDTTTVQNGLPTAAAVTITPGSADTNDTLTAVVSGWSDPDGDTEGYFYQWYLNGSALSGSTDPTLSADFTTRGDVVTVEVTPWDGYGRGTAITSGARTILNSSPTAPVVAVTPDNAEDDDTLTCTIVTRSTDDDGDSITYTYAWNRNGSATGITTQTVDPSYTTLGDTWECVVTASDGTDDDIGADEVEVGDYTAPSAPTLSSINSYRNEDTASVTGSSEANATITLYISSSSGTTTQTTTASGSGAFSYSLTGLTRGATYSMWATATDASGNTSGNSNTIGTEVCSPYDDYELTTTAGDTCDDSIVDWAILPDSGSTVLSITGNILDGSDSDWYLVQTSDALTPGINYYRFRVRMTHGSGSYAIIVHDGGCEDAYVDCSTSGYSEYEVYASDQLESGHYTPADLRYCNYYSYPYYNNCDDLSSDYYIEVVRTSSRYSCEYYTLEISNGIW